MYNREEYYPFGETSFGSFGKKRYRYCGKEKDEESGLYYYGARYFQPWSCRFLSVDPLALKYAKFSPYNYADNTPITDKDIDGMQTQKSQTSEQPDSTGTPKVQQTTNETNKPATSQLPEQGNDYFDEQGNYIKTVKNDKSENNIYILDKNGKETLLSGYKFTKNNASTLANITKHYAQYAGVDTTKLLNGSFSVAMKKETPIYFENGKKANLNETSSVSLFNNGTADTNFGSDAVMTSNWKGSNSTKVITVQVDTNGFTSRLLANKFNFINDLYHEGLHKKRDNSSEFNHLNIYVLQVQHASWKYTTEAQKLIIIANVKETIGDAKFWSGSKGESKTDIKLIREGGVYYENKFKKLLPTYFR